MSALLKSLTNKFNALKHRAKSLAARVRAPEISAAIFDWDATLVDTMEGICIASNFAFEEMRKKGYEVDIARTDKGYAQWTPEQTQVRFFTAAHEFFDTNFGHFGTDANGESVAAMAEKLWHDKLQEIHLDHVTVLKGTYRTIALLSRLGIPTAIVSNKDKDLLESEVEHVFGTYHAAKIVIKGAEPGHRGKPYPDPIFDALKDLNISASNHIWMIGDSLSDVKAGIKSGSHGILFGETNRAALKALQKETDPEKQSVITGANVGFVDSQQDLRNLISSAKIVPTLPYDPKNNPHFVCKHAAPAPTAAATPALAPVN
jgi:HAD superfamily hydrolase (TIGR01549 family)